MGFTLYPQPAVRSLVVGKGGARVDTDFLQRAGTPLPEFAGIYAQMMFLRVAMIAGDAAAPSTLFLTAGSGPSVEIGTDPRSVFRATGGAGTGVVGDVFLVTGPGNAFQVMVGFEELTSEAWKLGIRNNDPAADLDFTWVVADNAGETNQPWVDVRRFGYHTAAVVALKQPRGIAVDAALRTAYVAVVDFDGQHNSDDVSVIDTVTHSITGTLTAGLFPWAVAVDQATHEVYVTNCADATASVIDGKTRSLIATVPVGKNTSSVDVDTRTRAVYVGNGNDNTVSVIDANTRTVVATICSRRLPRRRVRRRRGPHRLRFERHQEHGHPDRHHDTVGCRHPGGRKGPVRPGVGRPRAHHLRRRRWRKHGVGDRRADTDGGAGHRGGLIATDGRGRHRHQRRLRGQFGR